MWSHSDYCRVLVDDDIQTILLASTVMIVDEQKVNFPKPRIK